jgi:bla regulator protein blaR1
MNDDGWDIQAKTLNDTSADDKTLPAQERNALRMRLALRSQHLLEDRFGLVFRRETRTETTYELHVEKSGHKLEPAQDAAAYRVDYRMSGGRGGVTGASVPLQTLALILSGRLARPVVDKTEISGRFNFKLDWILDLGQPGAITSPGAPELVGPSIFTAVKEQLGLRLEAVKGSVEVMVVEKVERPSEN